MEFPFGKSCCKREVEEGTHGTTETTTAVHTQDKEGTNE